MIKLRKSKSNANIFQTVCFHQKNALLFIHLRIASTFLLVLMVRSVSFCTRKLTANLVLGVPDKIAHINIPKVEWCQIKYPVWMLWGQWDQWI